MGIKVNIIAFICVLTSSIGCYGKTVNEYVSDDKTMLISITDNDSLYIDCYESGCGIVSYSLIVKKNTTQDKVYIGTYYDYETDYINPQKKREVIELKELDNKGNYLLSFNNKEKIRVQKVIIVPR